MDTLSDFDLGWLIGILEGEGCFSIKRGKRCIVPSITIKMTDEDVIDKVESLFNIGCRYTHQPKGKDYYKLCFTWELNGQKAIDLMTKLKPYLHKRRQTKIENIVKDWEVYKEGLKKDWSGTNNPFFGRKHSEESLRKIRETKLKNKIKNTSQ